MEWKDILLSDLTWSAALEILVRTLLMFTFVLLMLRASGKKGVRQLSIFEVAIIIALGSAAGDPMFRQDDAIVPSLIVFTAILVFYRVITWLSARYERFESVLEGDPVTIIKDGEIVLNNKGNSPFARDEFFAEMRAKSIEHMGQVRLAVLETNGTVSFFYFEDKDVKPGLPTLPDSYETTCTEVSCDGVYACCYCAHTVELTVGVHKCRRCGKKEWVEAVDARRIT